MNKMATPPQYADGLEEFYNMVNDPNESTNLALSYDHVSVKRELSKWLPVKNSCPVPRSHTRLIELKENAKAYWENELIGENDLIPKL